MIEVYDGVIPFERNKQIYSDLMSGPFFYGEKDAAELPVVGMVGEFPDGELIDYLQSAISTVYNISGKKHQRRYVNLFQPNERPYFHKDGPVITCLFYLTDIDNINVDEGGETQFLVDGEIIGVLPKPGRLVVFDGNILHRATSFRTLPRMTIAVKYFK